jgi:hypothetical protein
MKRTLCPSLWVCCVFLLVATHQPLTADEVLANSGKEFEANCVGRSAGLVGWWSLDETAGNTAFDLVSGNAGLHQGGPVAEPAVVLGGLNFDGIDDFVEIPDASELNFGLQSFTLMTWLKTVKTPGVEVLLDKRSFDIFGSVTGYHLFLFNGRLGLQLADGGFTNYISSAMVADGAFHHIAVTVVRQPFPGFPGILFYVDGVQVDSADPTDRTGFLTNAESLRLGTRSTGQSGSFDGVLDEVALYHRALSAPEIRAIHGARHAGVCKCAQIPCRPLAWWPFDAPSGPQVLDIADHTLGPHDGILEGPTRVLGKVGGALQFDTLEDRLFIDQSAGLDLDLARGGAFTVKAWVRTSAPSGPIVNNFAGSNDISFGWLFSLENGVPAFRLVTFEPFPRGPQSDGGPCTSTACTGLNLADDQWHLVGATVIFDPGGKNLTIRFYADGKFLQALPPVDVDGTTIPGDVSIGHLSLFLASEFFDGKIDEVQIFDQALTSADFAQIFAAGGAGECKPAAPPQVCGLPDSENCPASYFCDLLPASQCGALPLGGICLPRPEICTFDEDPVCGCDGQTYSNACVANWSGVSVAFAGPCL